MTFEIILILPDFKKEKKPLSLEFQGGIGVVHGKINITKYKDSQYSCAFKDYIFRILEDWLNSIPEIVNGKESRHDLYDNPWTFTFKPIGNDLEIRFFNYGKYGNISTEKINERLEGEGKPIVVSKKEFINEVILKSEELTYLLIEIDPSLVQRDYFNRFRTSIINAKNALKELGQ